MANDIAKKLKIAENSTLLTLHAPADFKKSLGAVPKGVTITEDAKDYQQIHWFVLNSAQVSKEIKKIMTLLKPGVICWSYYPKGTSKIQTDLTRDKGWDAFLALTNVQWLSLISFNDTWSAFAFRLKTDTDKKKEEKPKEKRAIFDFIDPENKIVKVPDDLAKAFTKNKKTEAFFNSLSFTNKKEYVEWIVTAKREETRDERVKGTIERLAKNWKNPRNL